MELPLQPNVNDVCKFFQDKSILLCRSPLCYLSSLRPSDVGSRMYGPNVHGKRGAFIAAVLEDGGPPSMPESGPRRL